MARISSHIFCFIWRRGIGDGAASRLRYYACRKMTTVVKNLKGRVRFLGTTSVGAVAPQSSRDYVPEPRINSDDKNNNHDDIYSAVIIAEP